MGLRSSLARHHVGAVAIAAHCARAVIAPVAPVLVIVCGLMLSVVHADAAPRCAGIDYNARIMEIIRSLPTGGGYSRGNAFVSPKLQTHNIGGGNWELRVYDGFPSHCTSATYALFGHLVAMLHNGGKIRLTVEQLRWLEVKWRTANGAALVDGQDPWWIFNANGAGAAALVKHTGVGINFRDDKLLEARPGDFLKIFWNGNVGASEQGHQVVYTGRRQENGGDMICFWGSQKQGTRRRNGRRQPLYFPARVGGKVHNGYGEVCRPRGDIKHMIFSRITCMENLAAGLADMRRRADAKGKGPLRMSRPFEDTYLMSLRKKSSNHATLNSTYDILPDASELASVGSAPREPAQ